MNRQCEFISKTLHTSAQPIPARPAAVEPGFSKHHTNLLPRMGL